MASISAPNRPENQVNYLKMKINEEIKINTFHKKFQDDSTIRLELSLQKFRRLFGLS